MTKLRVHNVTVTLDGYATGVNQRLDAPYGDGVDGIHDWLFATRTFHTMQGEPGGTTGTDDAIAAAGDAGVGATIIGRNMFSPQRGPWQDHEWRGWWGDNPPYHHDVFVMTHHLRPSIEMDGGTTFHFVDDTPEAVLAQATKAANGQDVRLGGGPTTIRAFLRAGLIDDLHLVIVPIIAGAGVRLLDDPLNAYTCVEMTTTTVTHIHLTRTTP